MQFLKSLFQEIILDFGYVLALKIYLARDFVDSTLDPLLWVLLQHLLQVLLKGPDVALDSFQLGDMALSPERGGQVNGHLMVPGPSDKVRKFHLEHWQGPLRLPSRRQSLVGINGHNRPNYAIAKQSFHVFPLLGLLSGGNHLKWALIADLIAYIQYWNLPQYSSGIIPVALVPARESAMIWMNWIDWAPAVPQPDDWPK